MFLGLGSGCLCRRLLKWQRDRHEGVQHQRHIRCDTRIGTVRTGFGVSHHKRLGLLERITGRDPVSFGKPEWLRPERVDETYFRLLPTGANEITEKEVQELAFVFGKDGELAAERLS
jgi:hypothetical protein